MPGTKQSASKKSRLTPRELAHDHEAGGWNLRDRAPKRRIEGEQDIGGDTGTSSDDDVEDETYVDPSAFEVRHHGKGPATDEGDEDDEDLGGQERDEDDDPMDDDEGDGQGRLRVTKPIYMYPNKAVNYHGTSMNKKLQKLRDVNPCANERTTSDRRFWAPFQQDYYSTVLIKKPKITHQAQYVD
jgi:hypothetical protein